jgi:hypothetical protein
MATLPKVLISRADYQIGGGVALGLRTQGTAGCPSWTAFKNDAQIIGGHWYGLCQGKTVTLRQIRDLGDVPYAP